MILHVYHMKYGSLNAAWDRHNFFVILGHFLPFHPVFFFFSLPLPYRPRKSKFWNNEKKHLQLLPWIPWMKILKNEKTPGDILLHKCTKNHDHMLLFFKIRCVTDVIFIFHFGLFFVLPPRHPTIQKIKI